MDHRDIVKLSEEVNSKFKEEKTILKKMGNDKTYEKFIKIFDKFEKVTSVLPDAMLGFYLSYQQHSSERDNIENLIKDNEDKYETLRKFENSVYPALVSDLKGLIDKIKNIGKDVGKESKIDLNLMKYKMEKTFDAMKEKLNSLIPEYKAKDGLIRVIEKLEKLLQLLISSNDLIQDKWEKKNLVDFISKINKAILSTSYNDKEELIKKELDVLIQSNVLLKTYKTAYQALEQYTFPLTEILTNLGELPDYMKVEGQNTTGFVNTIYDRIKMINNMMEDYGSFVKEIYKSDLINASFNNRDVINQPAFFVWKNDEYKHVIADLLSNRKVLLSADISKVRLTYQAIKFNQIRVFFRSLDPNRQKRLNDILMPFAIRMTHLGDSHYKFKNKTYRVIYNEKTLHHSAFIDLNEDGFHKYILP